MSHVFLFAIILCMVYIQQYPCLQTKLPRPCVIACATSLLVFRTLGRLVPACAKERQLKAPDKANTQKHRTLRWLARAQED